MCSDRGIGLERFRLMEVGLGLEDRKVDKKKRKTKYQEICLDEGCFAVPF